MNNQDTRRATLILADAFITVDFPVPIRIGDPAYDAAVAVAVTAAVKEHFDSKGQA